MKKTVAFKRPTPPANADAWIESGKDMSPSPAAPRSGWSGSHSTWTESCIRG
jgi:hypothetical protein